MAKVIGVRFRDNGKIYYFSSEQFEVEVGQNVIVETARGVEYGRVVLGNREIHDEKIISTLKPVIRIVTEDDDKVQANNKIKSKEAYDICLEKIKKHELEMKLIDCEYTFDNNKVLFYFTADGRIDFRELVKDLASVFKTRIELRQIGVRDHAKLKGFHGTCGQKSCCSRFMTDFSPLSIKMAKDQGITLDPAKISGVCGRLMCCLSFEEDNYIKAKKSMPKPGTRVETEDGIGVVISNDYVKEMCKVRVTHEDSEIEEYYKAKDIVKCK